MINGALRDHLLSVTRVADHDRWVPGAGCQGWSASCDPILSGDRIWFILTHPALAYPVAHSTRNRVPGMREGALSAPPG